MTVVACALAANLVLPVFAQAESLNSIKEKETQITRQGEELSVEIQVALNDVNDKYAEIENIKADISKAEATIKDSKEQIIETEAAIEKRKEAMGDRLKEMQVNSGNQRVIEVLLGSESLSDFVNRAYAMTVMQNAEKEKVNSLNEEKEKLITLQEKVKTTQSELKSKEADLETEAAVMDAKVSNLKATLADNQATLSQLAQARQTEEKRLADEKAAAEQAQKDAEKAAEKAKQEAEKASSTTSESSSSSATPPSSSAPSSSTEESTTPPASSAPENSGSSSGGKTMSMQSTAYSWSEAVNSNLSATGIDLSQNPWCVAVDPSVIPLNTMVEVSGYGVAIAGDTGGAIKGNIIDVHFPTVDQCIQWGRRQVTVTIL